MNKLDILKLDLWSKLSNLQFVEDIWLFGSRARGDYTDRSDIDIAISCPTATDEDWSRIMTLIDGSQSLLKIDCVRFDKIDEDEPLKKNIIRDRILLYTKNIPWLDSFISLGQAIDRLNEAVQHPRYLDDEFIRDATIQRFEFVTELFWKVLKKILMHDKVETTTPRDTLSKAYQFKLIDHQEQWLMMLDDRNTTSHVYRESMAAQVLARIPTYVKVFRASYNQIWNNHVISRDK